MAIHPNSPYYTQDKLQPGARGNTFIETLPGYREEEDRVNRTNTHLNVSAHDVPNCKWSMDDRLPVLFRYGFAYGFNQIIAPKGRVMALDPHKSKIEFSSADLDDIKKQYNVLTLANGGVPVRVRKDSDKYKKLDRDNDTTALVSTDASDAKAFGAGKEWAPIVGLDKAYTDKFYRPFSQEDEFKSATAQLTDAGLKINNFGNVVNASGVEQDVRPGNIPIGVLERNEYTRDEDAYNGMMPGPILTDAMIEMPWFLYKDKAEGNFWGSIYGNVYPGALIKADENGRMTVSPLSDPDTVAEMSLGEYEAERRQVIGEVYSANQNLVPEGAAKWAIWSLEDRLNFEEFNPATWKATNRKGEDSINNSPYASTGEYPGYPYDKAFTESNLHMLGARLRDGNYNIRLEQEYQYSNLGIPGLTDGYNAVVRDIPEERIGEIHYRGDNSNVSYVDQIFKVSEVNVDKGSLSIRINDGQPINITAVGQALVQTGDEGNKKDVMTIVYLDELQGLIKVRINDEAADEYLKAQPEKKVTLYAQYKKRGLAGVPTFMDWDGVVGSCKILLTK